MPKPKWRSSAGHLFTHSLPSGGTDLDYRQYILVVLVSSRLFTNVNTHTTGGVQYRSWMDEQKISVIPARGSDDCVYPNCDIHWYRVIKSQ